MKHWNISYTLINIFPFDSIKYGNEIKTLNPLPMILEDVRRRWGGVGLGGGKVGWGWDILSEVLSLYINPFELSFNITWSFH